jgi:hypothetical protein
VKEGGAAVAVQVLASARLPEGWARLDAFEGLDYRRILVPVFVPDATGERRLYTVANLYAVSDRRSGEPARSQGVAADKAARASSCSHVPRGAPCN